MGAKENLQRIVDKKQAEIADLESQIERARIYLHAIQDSIKALPRDNSSVSDRTEEVTIRPGTLLAKAREALQRNGGPMHISQLLTAIGLENTKPTRVSLVGSLGTYVRRKAVFSRPGPNIFGLIGMENTPREEKRDRVSDLKVSLPDDFGK